MSDHSCEHRCAGLTSAHPKLGKPDPEEEELRAFNDKAKPPPDHQKQLVKLVASISNRHSQWQVFSDFAEMAAISISNAVDLDQRDKREERYLEIVKRYKPDEIKIFPEMLAEVTFALEREPGDVLDRTFHDLELHNKYAGQFFSPYHLCRMMAKMTIADTAYLEARISERGFVTAQEPAVGSGAMVIALAHEMLDANVNYQEHLHVTAIDIDSKCVHMAYLQFALLHIPAIIVHGNSLNLEEFSRWYTPAHILGGWNWKLRRSIDGPHALERVPEPPVPEPETTPDDQPAPPGQLSLF